MGGWVGGCVGKQAGGEGDRQEDRMEGSKGVRQQGRLGAGRCTQPPEPIPCPPVKDRDRSTDSSSALEACISPRAGRFEV